MNYKFDKNSCWYKGVCNKFNTNGCNSSCIRYIEIFNLMSLAGIPPKRQYSITLTPQLVDEQNFDFLNGIKNDINTFVNNGENLYIFSLNTGNGKTSWSIKLLQKYFDTIWNGNGLRCRGVFVHTPSFLKSLVDGIKDKSIEFEKLKENILNADIVVWDDIASTKLTDFQHTGLLTFIDHRNLSCLSNIFTGNIVQNDLPNAVGHRLASRIWNDSTIVEFLGTDRRGGNS